MKKIIDKMLEVIDAEIGKLKQEVSSRSTTTADRAKSCKKQGNSIDYGFYSGQEIGYTASEALIRNAEMEIYKSFSLVVGEVTNGKTN